MTNITLNTATRKCTSDKYFLGYEGENNINKLIFKFEDGFRDGLGILNIKKEEETGYLDLTKVGDTYELEVKSALLSKIGEITFQFTVNEPDGTVIKYDAFTMVVKDSIDADVEMPEDYPNWIDMANAKLAEVDEAITNVETAIENANDVSNELLQAKVNGEFNGKDGKDGVDGISSEITVKTNTETEYVLTVKDVNGSFDTPNLKGKDSEGGIVNETDPLYSADKPKLALKSEIPTKISQLANDSSFATESFVTNKIAEAELSGGDVDLSGYATKDELNEKADVEDIPTKVSELDNDSGFITDYEETDPTVPNHVKAITEADITNWNNKQNVLTAGSNITIENGVISSTASGGGGFIEKTLFDGSLAVTGVNGTLTDSILNYDFALVTVCADLEGWGINSLMQEIIVNTKNITFKGNSEVWDGFYDVYNSNGTGNWYRVCFGFVDETTIALGALTNGGNWKNAKIKKVTGYKMGGGSSSSDNYSTEETVVGTWIDGKPLYQKVVVLANLGNMQAAANRFAHNIANVDNIWISDGYLLTVSTGLRYHLGSPYRYFACDKTHVQVTPTGAGDYSAYNIYFILRYTKTTD